MKALESNELIAMIDLIADRSDDETMSLMREQLLQMRIKDLQTMHLHCVEYPDYVAMEVEQAVLHRVLSLIEYFYKEENKEERDLLSLLMLLVYFSCSHVEESWIKDELNRLADEIKATFTEEDSLSSKCKKLADHLGGLEQFHGNQDDYYCAENSYLDQVLKKKKGNPITLSAIYLLIAERLSLPLSGVGIPGHFIVGLFENQDEDARLYIDPFRKGLIMSKLDCIELVQQLGRNFDEAFLKPVNHDYIFLRSLNNLLSIYETDGNLRRSDMIVRYINTVQNK